MIWECPAATTTANGDRSQPFKRPRTAQCKTMGSTATAGTRVRSAAAVARPPIPTYVQNVALGIAQETAVSERWIEWVEPYGPNSEPLYLRLPASTAIAVAKNQWGAKSPYKDDEDALNDFMIVHWATFTDAPRSQAHEQDQSVHPKGA